jgi:hypothetical protein
MRFRNYFDPPEPDPLAGPELTLIGQIKRETDMAVLFAGKKGEAWLPKSLIAVVHDVGKVRVTMPSWFARKKGLV